MYRPSRLINLITKYTHISSQNAIQSRLMFSLAGYNLNQSVTWNYVLQSNAFKTDFIRSYAKGKDKKKEKGKTKVQVNETQLGEIINLENMKTEMHRCVEVLKTEYTKNLSLRSAAGSIESLIVNLDGKDHTLQELAQIVRKNPKAIVLNMAVFPQAIPAALKAIQKSGMNLNPQQDGTTLYIPVPKVTKEYREQLAKSAKQLFVKCRDSIKDEQSKHIKSLKKNSNVSEDVIHNAEAQIVTLADGYINEAQKILDSKHSELLGND